MGRSRLLSKNVSSLAAEHFPSEVFEVPPDNWQKGFLARSPSFLANERASSGDHAAVVGVELIGRRWMNVEGNGTKSERTF